MNSKDITTAQLRTDIRTLGKAVAEEHEEEQFLEKCGLLVATIEEYFVRYEDFLEMDAAMGDPNP